MALIVGLIASIYAKCASNASRAEVSRLRMAKASAHAERSLISPVTKVPLCYSRVFATYADPTISKVTAKTMPETMSVMVV